MEEYFIPSVWDLCEELRTSVTKKANVVNDDPDHSGQILAESENRIFVYECDSENNEFVYVVDRYDLSRKLQRIVVCPVWNIDYLF